MDIENIAFGAIVRPKDKRDYKSESLGSVSMYPDTLQTDVPLIYMQGKYPTCGAHAGAQLANILFGITSSPKFLWKQIKTLDTFGLNDGTDMRSIFKALQTYGICTLDILNNDPEDSLEAYSALKELTPTMIADASKRKITSYGFIDRPTIAQIKQAIATYKVVILLVDCGDGWWTNKVGQSSWSATDILPLRLGNYASGHFVVATGYGLTLINGANSWSISWADAGKYNFDSTYLPFVRELGFATIGDTKYIFNSNLYVGLKNADVHALQVKLGMPLELQTGFFGSKTFSAVIAYQKANKISPTGFVGALTRAVLNQ